MVSGGASKLDLNLLRLLRKQVTPVCGVGLDGGDNVVGPPEDDRPQLLGLQLATAEGSVDAFGKACAGASGSPVSMELWVRAAEVIGHERGIHANTFLDNEGCRVLCALGVSATTK